MPVASVSASRRLMAGFSRPKTRMNRLDRLCCAASGMNGVQTSALPGNLVPGGITPITVAGTP